MQCNNLQIHFAIRKNFFNPSKNFLGPKNNIFLKNLQQKIYRFCQIVVGCILLPFRSKNYANRIISFRAIWMHSEAFDADKQLLKYLNKFKMDFCLLTEFPLKNRKHTMDTLNQILPKLKQRHDDNILARVNHFYSPALLLILALYSAYWQFIEDPLVVSLKKIFFCNKFIKCDQSSLLI